MFLHRLKLQIVLAVCASTSLFVGTFTWAATNDVSKSALNGKVQKNTIAQFSGNGSGILAVFAPDGKKLGTCPLKHTSVEANISGYVNHVTVKQLFENPFKEKIEAVYTFPLSETAAVDDMLMKVGTRTIHGTIKKREEAQQIYNNAKANGQAASLLNQERTNIFTQYVANILPGNKIEITLNYVDILPYEGGTYTFAFPTVVGPRFIPGNAVGQQGNGRVPDTDQVPDASLITPPVANKGERAGHDISIDVNIKSGVALQNISSKLHEVVVNKSGTNSAHINLVDKNTIPNKDFVLTYDVASDKLQSGYLTHAKNGAGYFTVMVMPPKKAKAEQISPKEMIFIIDCSGSQSGAPLDKAKETLSYIVDHMNANDTFQIIAFNNNVTTFANQPQLVSADMKARAKRFITGLQANGGTWMAPAVEAACKIPADDHRLRIVTFMTDGYVGNDFEIIGMVKKLRGLSRWFPFGTGNSVNRMLIDNMANEGGGEAEYVLLNSSGNEVGKKFYDRISSPVLTDVKLDFHGLPVKEVYPVAVSDVWAEKPLYIKGRYTEAASGIVTITGYAAGKPYKEDIKINLPANESNNESLGSIWARAKVDRLMSEDWFGAQKGAVNQELKDEIIKVALDHHIMTQYTSFVAVEEKRITDKGEPKTIAVPVEMPDGVSYDMTIGRDEQKKEMERSRAQAFGSVGRGSFSSPYSEHSRMLCKSFSGMPSQVKPAPCLAPPVRMKADGVAQEPRKDDKKRLDFFKLSPGLQTMFTVVGARAYAEKQGWDIVNGMLAVKITVKNIDEKTMKALKALHVQIVKTKNNDIICRVETEDVLFLTRMEEIISIKEIKI